MADPAVEAAQRASREDPGWPKRVIAEEAAREALKPVQAWYAKWSTTYAEGVSGNALIIKGILAELKPLIYPSEES